MRATKKVQLCSPVSETNAERDTNHDRREGIHHEAVSMLAGSARGARGARLGLRVSSLLVSASTVRPVLRSELFTARDLRDTWRAGVRGLAAAASGVPRADDICSTGERFSLRGT